MDVSAKIPAKKSRCSSFTIDLAELTPRSDEFRRGPQESMHPDDPLERPIECTLKFDL